MSGERQVSEVELHAFLDGELPAARQEEVQAALARDPALAEKLALYALDKAALVAAFAPAAQAELPAAWLARIERAAPPRPRAARRLALAASLALALGATLYAGLHQAPPSILQQAEAARAGRLAALGASPAVLPPPGARDALLRSALRLPVRVPDLARFGYRLVAMELYGGPSAGLRYRRGDGRELDVFLRRSDGHARFDLLREGRERICLWQDDVVGAVLSGEMSAGEMMRLASLAYATLNL